MLAITLQDLRFRARRFLIASIGAALVFAMTLLLSGLAAGFSVEINRTVHALGAQSWVVAAGASGRMVALSPLSAAVVPQVAADPGAGRVGPVVIAPQVAEVNGAQKSANLIGFIPGDLGAPPIVSGRQVASNGEAVVDARLKLGVGRQFTMNGHHFTVVGTASGLTLLSGVPNAYVTLPDAQAVVFGGRAIVSAVLTAGVPRTVPAGMAVYTNKRIEQATLNQMAAGRSSISSSRFLMWLIAAVIVAALVYVSALERARDFAVLKALGSSSTVLFGGLAVQATLVSLVAAALGAVLANFMRGIFAQPVVVPSSAYILLPVSALIIGLLASLAALRRAVSVDPATAFAGP
jgi:putative ABC transport system permease protein